MDRLGIDRRLSGPIHRLVMGPLDYLLAVPGMAFGTYVMPLTLGAIGLWLGWRVLAVGVAASLVTVAITQALKHWVKRERPDAPESPRRVKLRGLVRNPSFPSGDSAQAAVVALLLVLNGPVQDSLRWLFMLPLPLCMFARVYFGAHWIGDTLAGAVIGAAVLAACHFAAAQIPGL